MDADGSTHEGPVATAVPPIMPPVRRGGGAAARRPLPTPVGSGGGGAAAAAPAKATASAADDATAAERLAVAADGVSDCDDHGRPKLLPSLPSRWTKKAIPGGRLPPIQALFPADGAASAGRVKRARPSWEAEEGGGKTERAGKACDTGSPADHRPTKRHTRDTWGGSTGGRGGGGADAAGLASWVSPPAVASLSPVTECGGSSAAAAAALSTGATIPAGRRWANASTEAVVASPSAAAPAAPAPAAASVGSPTVGQRLQYWSTVLAETSGTQAARSGGGIGEGSPPVKPSPPAAGRWVGWAASESPHGGSVGRVGATAAAGEPRRAPSMVGRNEAREVAVDAGGGSGGDVGGSAGAGAVVYGERGGSSGFERSFDLKARILDRSAAGSGVGDLPRLSMPFYASSGGGFPAGGTHAAPLSTTAVLQMGGGGSGAAVPIGHDSRVDGAAARSPSGSAQALSGGCSTLSSAASVGLPVRRVGPELLGMPSRADSGGGIFTPRAGNHHGAVGGGPASGAPATDGAVTHAATMAGPVLVGGGVYPGSAAAHVADSSVITAATAAAISARRLRRLAPTPSPYRPQQGHPLGVPPPPGQRAALDAYANERPYACTRCPIAFKRRYDLQQHHLAVHEKRRPFACPVCGAAFSHAGTRSKHVRTVHEKVKPFPCDACDMRFSERGNLSKHRQRLHG